MDRAWRTEIQRDLAAGNQPPRWRATGGLLMHPGIAEILDLDVKNCQVETLTLA